MNTDTVTTPETLASKGIPAPGTGASSAASLYQQLRTHLAVLKLHDAAQALPAVLDTAAAEQLSLTAALERLLAIEVEATEARRLAGRLRFACLPTPATLADFDYDAAAGLDRSLITELGTCRYLESATNVLLIGPPGVGKTHIAVGLARAAAHAGYRTYFTTAADLAARCHRAAIEGRWATTMRFYAGPTLLVIDELGYLPLPAEAASALFQVVSQRYLKTSIVITTNRGVGSWGEVLGDTTVAARHARPALHRSVVLNLDGDPTATRPPRTRRQAPPHHPPAPANHYSDHRPRVGEFQRATAGEIREPHHAARSPNPKTSKDLAWHLQRSTSAVLAARSALVAETRTGSRAAPFGFRASRSASTRRSAACLLVDARSLSPNPRRSPPPLSGPGALRRRGYAPPPTCSPATGIRSAVSTPP